MSVPRSDTDTRSASFWSFNHRLLSFSLFLPCSLMISPFILSVAKCSGAFHYSPPYGFCFFWLSDIMPRFCLLQVMRREQPLRPLQVWTICTLFTHLIFNLRCVLCAYSACFYSFFYDEAVAVRKWSAGNTWHQHATSLPVVLTLRFSVKTREAANDG